jgi:hypothetical protein
MSVTIPRTRIRRVGRPAGPGPIAITVTAIRRWRTLWLAIVLAVLPSFYIGQLVLLRIRFGHWPNYTTFYNWPANIARIIHGTPSFWDIVSLARDEYLFETGYLNTHYGLGIAEWSMTIIPEQIIYVLLLGVLLATNVVLILERNAATNRGGVACAGAATGLGGSLLGLSNISLTWALCCGSPNWAVALTLMGFGSTSALWLVPYGPLFAWAGVALLLVPPALLLRDISRRSHAAGQY